MRRYKPLIVLISILVAFINLNAQGFQCPEEINPVVCKFLNRYIQELCQWNRGDVSLSQKMRDDKFIILDGSLENLSLTNETTKFMLIRYDNKAYEASWYNGNKLLLSVAFPIQYELLLGMPQVEIEKMMQEFLTYAPQRQINQTNLFELDSIGKNIYETSNSEFYEIPSLNNKKYLYKDFVGQIKYISDTLQMSYTISNLFQGCLPNDYVVQISQNIYGFNKLHYTTTLNQWLNYCANEGLNVFVAVEEELEKSITVLIVAQNIDLGYNHVLSANIPKDFIENSRAIINVKMTAFIPTHNVKDLYEKYVKTKKKELEWENE